METDADSLPMEEFHNQHPCRWNDVDDQLGNLERNGLELGAVEPVSDIRDWPCSMFPQTQQKLNRDKKMGIM